MQPTVAVSRERALAGMTLCSQGAVPAQMSVMRRSHAATEAVLIGATLARLALSLVLFPVILKNFSGEIEIAATPNPNSKKGRGGPIAS